MNEQWATFFTARLMFIYKYNFNWQFIINVLIIYIKYMCMCVDECMCRINSQVFLLESNQIKSNHFYCHITTAQVPWWVKFLWACSRQCRKTTDNLHMDRQCKKTTNNLPMDRQCKKTTNNLPMDRQCKKNNKQFTYGQTVQKNCTGAFTVLQTVQKKNNNNLHMDRQCKKTTTAIYIWTDSAKNNNNLHMDSTYLQTVQKTMCKIHIHILSTLSVL